jgi:SAM-dependent methyltransferase
MESTQRVEMSAIERAAYNSLAEYAFNQAALPLKLLVPQPIIQRLPFLTTNQDIRTRVVLSMVRGRLLDIGCGANELVRRYRESGEDGIGVDVYPWPNVDLLVEDAAKLPYPDESFDSITFVACLNHIPNREDVLREAKRLLAPSGRIVLTNLTPTISWLWHRWAFWDDDQHERGMAEGEQWGFRHDDLIALLARTGFRLVRRDPFSWGFNNLYVFE